MPARRTTFEELERKDDFVGRHIGPRPHEVAAMLDALGLKSLDALITKAVPEPIRSTKPLPLPGSRTERETVDRLRAMAARNRVMKSLIGMGYYDTITPPVIQRNVLENPGWYTPYTPYQPEISQGRLEALLTFQTMVCDLTGMELANASLLDEATAAAEAMTMCRRLSKGDSEAFFVSKHCHVQTIKVVRTRAEPLGIEVVVGDPEADLEGHAVFGVLLQYPTTDGDVRDYSNVVKMARDKGALVVAAADLLALTLLTPPGEWGADVVVGNSQRFGVPLGFGGPHAAFFATRDSFRRSIPGRIVGASVDARGRPALRLALQTREQHIRREKATSNICTAQVLLAVMAGMYAAYHGPDGLRTIARRIHRLTATCAAGLRRLGFEILSDRYFDTLTVATAGQAGAILQRAAERGYNLRLVDGDHIGLSFDETTSKADVEAVWRVFADKEETGFGFDEVEKKAEDGLPADMLRRSDFLSHPVFNSYHSETEMMRYLHRLEERDIALNRSMIPLGSCTMKLTAATEMAAVSWPEFCDLHPYAPADQTQGYQELIADLEDMLCAVTGFDAISVQPNAGSQGEYAGLLAIRAYHQSRGEPQRDICLIPSSAHGTNPASAVMAGLRVVVVACDDEGNVDIGDLESKAREYSDGLAALMITYPSTHGVFEAAIVDICEIIHDNGGQVYLDGANLNALIGLSLPAAFGADVAHLNLHKTFCIPHGGGGPGVGPIGVKRHLAPFLPGHPIRPDCAGDAGSGTGPVSAAPWGSAGILSISWAYMYLMGGEGLAEATRAAILNANYVAHRLAPHFPVLYTGPNGMVAHECIVDLRPLKDFASVDDVAKRLMDFGFHAPTMSFPVAGTLMVEPTESESKAELDRFCEAMIAIRQEIKAVEEGRMDAEDNPLRNAPHTAEDVVSDEWTHPYSRAQAAYPAAQESKYWPPVGRVDNVYGDRHLVCSCPPVESYMDAAE